MEPAALAEVRAPAILFWEFNHYVVFDGLGRRFGRRGVHINDPDRGRRFVPMEDFDTSFTGVVLTFEPGEDFQRGGRSPASLAALPARLRGTSGTLLAALVASFLLVLVGRLGARVEPYLHRHVPVRRADLAAGRLFAAMAATVALHRRSHRSAAGQSATRPRHLLHAQQRPLPAPSASASGRLLRAAQPGRPRTAPAVQRHRRRDAGQRPGRRGRGRIVVVVYALLLWSYDPQLTVLGVGIALLNIVAMRVVIRLRATGTQKLRADRASHQHLLQRSSAHRDDEGDGRRERLLPRWAGQHARPWTEQQRLGCRAPRWRSSRRRSPAQQRADPADRRSTGGGGPHHRRSARRLPGAGHRFTAP